MSLEVFIYRDDTALRRTLPELQQELGRAGVVCRIEELDDGPWLVLEGHQTDMSITVDADGTAASAMVQCQDSASVTGKLLNAFEQLGWIVCGDEE